MEEYLSAIANFGFPIVVSGYLLFRFETKIEKLEDSINKLITVIENKK